MKWILIAIITLAIFGFIEIGKQIDDCKSKGGTPVQTNEGTTCISGVIK